LAYRIDHICQRLVRYHSIKHLSQKHNQGYWSFYMIVAYQLKWDSFLHRVYFSIINFYFYHFSWFSEVNVIKSWVFVTACYSVSICRKNLF